MPAITPDSLMSLEAYAKARPKFRERVLAHKRLRTLHLGEHVTLLFEDELTIRYQIQEMLRIERVFEEAGIRDELDAYNPLVPDGSNLKATMLIEYEDVDERKDALAKLNGIERCAFIDVEGCPRVVAIADEDLPRRPPGLPGGGSCGRPGDARVVARRSFLTFGDRHFNRGSCRTGRGNR
jgi:hypothetical protein